MYKVGVWNISPYMSTIFKFFPHYLPVNFDIFLSKWGARETKVGKWGREEGNIGREGWNGYKGGRISGEKCEGKRIFPDFCTY